MIHKKTGGAGTERFYINFVRPFGSGRILGGEKTVNEKVPGKLTSHHATFQWPCRRFCHLDFSCVYLVFRKDFFLTKQSEFIK